MMEMNLHPEQTVEKRFLPVVLNGQLCVYDKIRGHLYHWVREPFWSAGKIYRWPGRPAALGANRAILDYAESHGAKIRVFVRDKIDRCYETESKTWLGFARKHKAIHWASDVAIYLLQWCPRYFRTIRGDPAFGIIAAVFQGGKKEL